MNRPIHRSDDHLAGVDPGAGEESNGVVGRQRLGHPRQLGGGAQCTHGIVFVCPRQAEQPHQRLPGSGFHTGAVPVEHTASHLHRAPDQAVERLGVDVMVVGRGEVCYQGRDRASLAGQPFGLGPNRLRGSRHNRSSEGE